MFCHHTSRRPDSSKTWCNLDKNLTSISMHSLCKISPSCKHCSCMINPGKQRQIIYFCYGRINSMTDRDQSRCQKPRSSFGTRKKILKHFIIRPTWLFTHIQIPHRSHYHAVFDHSLIHLNRRKQGLIRIQFLRHRPGAQPAVFFFLFHPIPIGFFQSD